MSASLGPSSSEVRRPRVRVSVSDTVFMPQAKDLPNVIEATVTQVNTYRACHYTLTAAIRPADQLGAKFWAEAPDPRIEVFYGFLPDGAPEGQLTWQSMILGRADDVDVNPIEGTITILGRDLTAVLIDAKTAQTFLNQTSSEVVTKLAKEAGLKVQATKTSTPVDQYYQIDHTMVSLDQFHHSMTDWDIMTYLARQEGFDLFMNRDTVVFQPAATANTKPFQIHYATDASGNPIGDMTGLKLHHSKTLAKDIKVTVKSWNSKANRPITATATGANAKAGKHGYGPAQNYVIIRPGLTLDAAQKLAEQMRAEFSRHERVVDIEMPGELTLTPQSMVQLIGTNTDFDQSYYPDEIRRSMTFTGGFTQSVRGKNHSPQSQTQPT